MTLESSQDNEVCFCLFNFPLPRLSKQAPIPGRTFINIIHACTSMCVTRMIMDTIPASDFLYTTRLFRPFALLVLFCFLFYVDIICWQNQPPVECCSYTLHLDAADLSSFTRRSYHPA